MSRLTRQEIKRDEVLEAVGSFFEYVRDHWRAIVGGAAALVGAVVVGFLISSFMARREGEAGERLAAAMRVHQARIDPEAARPDDADDPVFADEAARAARARELFAELREEAGSTEAAAIASVYEAELAARDGDLETARRLWEEFLAGRGDHMLASEVRINLIVLDRSEGRGEELAAELRAMLSGGSSPLPEDVVLYQLALTLDELGRSEEAVATYQQIVEEHPASPYSALARSRGGVEAPAGLGIG